MARHINDIGLQLIEQWEGLFLSAYHGAADRPGLLTIGFGHTDAAGPPRVSSGMTITKKQADDILRSDFGQVEGAIERLVKVPLTDNQFAALVAFTFNVGQAALANSTLLKKLNTGDYDSVPTELMKWTKANGKRVQGLANRRAAEAGLWVKGAPIASQYVEPDENKETILSSLAKPETIGTAIASSGGIATALGGVGGPVGYAIAAVIILGAGVAAFWIIKHIMDRGT